jgi:thymidylate synthase ThyX
VLRLLKYSPKYDDEKQFLFPSSPDKNEKVEKLKIRLQRKLQKFYRKNLEEERVEELFEEIMDIVNKNEALVSDNYVQFAQIFINASIERAKVTRGL